MEGGDYARIPFSLVALSFPPSFCLSPILSLRPSSPFTLSISLFAKTVISASNKHFELSKKSARRTNGNARLSPSSHLYLSLSSQTGKSAIHPFPSSLSIPFPARFPAHSRRCTHEASVYAFPSVICL